MATAATTQPGDHLPTPPPPAEINPRAAALLADLRTPLVANQHSLHWITENICSISENKTPLWWWIAFVPCAHPGGGLLQLLWLPHLYGRRRLG